MIELTAETPTASTVPEPWAKSPVPGLWRVKGMQLPAYVQHVSHDLMSSGAASTESQAIQMAVGIIKKWAAGIPVGGETRVGSEEHKHPGKIHPDVQAAAQKAVAEWEAKRAKAHAQSAANAAARRDMSVQGREEIDLAGATPVFSGNPGFTGNPGYGAVPQRRREHVHRGGETTGGMMDIAEMTQKQVKHHMATMHAVNVDGVPDAKLRRDHNALHKPKKDNPPDRDNGTMSRKKEPRHTEAGAGTGEQTGRTTQRMGKEQGQMRGGPGPGGVSTGSANTGYPTTGDPVRKTGPYERYDQPWYTENPGTTEGIRPSANPASHTAPKNDQQVPTPPEIGKTMRGLQQSGLGRQQKSPTGGNDRDMDSGMLAKPETGINRQQAKSNVGPTGDHITANPSMGQITGDSPPPAAVRTAAQAKAAGRYRTGRSYSRTYDAWGNVIDLADMVPSPNAAVRKAALKKGEALPHESGSPGKARFPLTNRTLASRAVKMVQLAKGDKTKIRRYIMATLRKKGWGDLIPANWSASGDSSGD